jgi:hypothetical protein
MPTGCAVGHRTAHQANTKKFALFHAHSCTVFSLECGSSFEINTTNSMTIAFIKKKKRFLEALVTDFFSVVCAMLTVSETPSRFY